MKTAISVLLVVLAFGLCHGQMKDSNYTKVQHYGTCYLKGSDCPLNGCKYYGGCRSSVEAAECCNVYKGCSYFEPANQQCYPCTGNGNDDCGDGKLGKCYQKPDCQGDFDGSLSASQCCRSGGCSYEDPDTGTCYSCTENQQCIKPPNRGHCFSGSDCTNFMRFSVEAAECCNVYKGCSYFEPRNKQCYFCKIDGCHQ